MDTNEIQPNITTPNNKGLIYALVAGLILLLITTIAFGSYLYINNNNQQKKINDLNSQIETLKSAAATTPTPITTPTTTATEVVGESEFSTYNGGKVVKFSVQYPPMFTLVSDNFIKDKYELLNLQNKSDSSPAVKIEIISLSSTEDFVSGSAEQTLQILGNRYSKNSCGEIPEANFVTAGTVRYAVHGTKTSSKCQSDMSTTVYVLQLKDNHYVVLSTAAANDVTLIEILVNSITYLNN